MILRPSLVKPIGRRLNFPPRCRPGGGIGRHRGFKIPRPFKAIPVRVRSRVLFSCRRSLRTIMARGSAENVSREVAKPQRGQRKKSSRHDRNDPSSARRPRSVDPHFLVTHFPVGSLSRTLSVPAPVSLRETSRTTWRLARNADVELSQLLVGHVLLFLQTAYDEGFGNPNLVGKLLDR